MNMEKSTKCEDLWDAEETWGGFQKALIDAKIELTTTEATDLWKKTMSGDEQMDYNDFKDYCFEVIAAHLHLKEAEAAKECECTGDPEEDASCYGADDCGQCCQSLFGY